MQATLCNAMHCLYGYASLNRLPQVGVALDTLGVLDGGCRVDRTEDDAGHKREEEGERRLVWVRAELGLGGPYLTYYEAKAGSDKMGGLCVGGRAV